jgi:hypothetical protein
MEHMLTYLHGKIIWTLLISDLQTRKVGVLDGKAICLLKVLDNRLHCALFIYRKAVAKEHHYLLGKQEKYHMI